MRTLAKALLVVAVLLAWSAPASAQQERPALPALTEPADDGLTRALTEGRLTEAEYALARARSLFRLGAVRRAFGDVERLGGRDATLVLRDLAVRLRELSGAERAQADRLLARPDRGGVPVGNGWSRTAPRVVSCTAHMCFHWVTTTGDAPQPADADSDDIPDWVEETQAEFENVWTHEIDTLGFRAPLSDLNSRPTNGGNDRLDIYLDDLGVSGVFGYCTSDDPNANNPTVSAVSAYCVVDNDYAAVQYGTLHTPEEFLQVTAAHEFHHASQFAYDWLEDVWLLEGTATNMEETVYPGVNDNIFFLEDWSPLSRPALPLDRGGFGDSEYGSWIFWRFLEEKGPGDRSSIIRRVWERAAAALPSDPDHYSLRAVYLVLRARRSHLADEFADFGVANRRHDYLDGSLYPGTPTARRFWIGPSRPSTGRQVRRLKHLATQFFSFRPGRRVSSSAKIRVNVDVDVHGGRATLIVHYRDGTQAVRPYNYTRSGFGSRRVDFGRGVVRRVDLVLSNGSSRTRCWRDPGEPPFFSCFGAPRDDGRIYSFRAILRD
jgi:hypothetical protein